MFWVFEYSSYVQICFRYRYLVAWCYVSRHQAHGKISPWFPEHSPGSRAPKRKVIFQPQVFQVPTCWIPGALKSSGSSGSTWWPWEICLLVGGPRWWVRVAEAGRMRRLFHSGPSKMCKEYLKLALITGRGPPLRPCFTALASTSSPARWVLMILMYGQMVFSIFCCDFFTLVSQMI